VSELLLVTAPAEGDGFAAVDWVGAIQRVGATAPAVETDSRDSVPVEPAAYQAAAPAVWLDTPVRPDTVQPFERSAWDCEAGVCAEPTPAK